MENLVGGRLGFIKEGESKGAETWRNICSGRWFLSKGLLVGSLLHIGGHGFIGHPDVTSGNRYRGFSYCTEASDTHRGAASLRQAMETLGLRKTTVCCSVGFANLKSIEEMCNGENRRGVSCLRLETWRNVADINTYRTVSAHMARDWLVKTCVCWTACCREVGWNLLKTLCRKKNKKTLPPERLAG